jgi:hypothetical protein
MPDSYLHAPQLREEDVFLASYPRSGNTWMRVMLSYLLYPGIELESLDDIQALVPDIYLGLGDRRKLSVPTVMKTHQPYAHRHEPFRPELYRKVIYLARNPVDVYRSYYDYSLNRSASLDVPPDVFVSKCLAGAWTFGSWHEHVLSWLEAAKENDYLVLKYEDMVLDVSGSLKRVADYLGLERSDDDLSRIVQKTGLGEMRGLAARYSKSMKDKYSVVRKSTERREIRQEFSEQSVQTILSRSREAMVALGYDITASAQA